MATAAAVARVPAPSTERPRASARFHLRLLAKKNECESGINENVAMKLVVLISLACHVFSPHY